MFLILYLRERLNQEIEGDKEECLSPHILFSFFFATGPLSFIIALVSVALFSGFIVYDIQRIKFSENTMSAAILLTVSIYLDILNLFLSLLRLFGYGNDE